MSEYTGRCLAKCEVSKKRPTRCGRRVRERQYKRRLVDLLLDAFEGNEGAYRSQNWKRVAFYMQKVSAFRGAEANRASLTPLNRRRNCQSRIELNPQRQVIDLNTLPASLLIRLCPKKTSWTN